MFTSFLVHAQLKVQIGDLCYLLSGVEASVTSNRTQVRGVDNNTEKYYYVSQYDKEEYVIPSSVNYNGYDYKVTSIGYEAFVPVLRDGTLLDYYYDSYHIRHDVNFIKTIRLSNSISIVEEFAFACHPSLETVDLPDVRSIGGSAFHRCVSLNTISMPNVEEIGSSAFYSCSSLESVSMPNVKSIESSAFYSCSSLKSVYIPNVETIGQYAFQSCQNLMSITIPETANNFGNNVFYNCPLLREIRYLSSTPPTNWVATSKTYVPDLVAYSTPKYRINSANIIEMITFGENSFTYSGQSPTPSWTNNVEGYTASLTMPTLNKNVGEHEEIIPVTFTNGAETFTANVVYRYSINPASLTITAPTVSREYGEENPQFNITYSGLINGDGENVFTSKPSVTTTATKTSPVGEYPITISGGNSANYEFVYEPGTLTITKAPLTAKVDDSSRQYGTNNPAFTVSYTGLKNDESVPKWSESLKIETNATIDSDVGTYPITASGVPVNYELSQIEDGTLTVSQAPLTIKANNATRMYYEEDPPFEFTCSGFLNNEDKQVLTKSPILTTDATQTSSAGKYKITPSDAAAKNYYITYEDGELTITKRQLNVTSHCSREYGEENPSFEMEYNGLVNNETESVFETKPTGKATATKTSPAGEYPITISGGSSANYEFFYEPGVLTVTKAPLSAKVNDAMKVYGEENPIFTIEFFGLKNSESEPEWATAPTFQTDATKSSGVGQYNVTAINGVAKNYDLADVSMGVLRVSPAPLTIKVNDAVRQYYAENPQFTFTCNGFVNGDNKEALTTSPTVSTTATTLSGVGTYEIKAENASSPNYSISYTNGTLTITPRTLFASVGTYERKYNEENPVFEIKYDGFVGNDDVKVLITEPIAKTSATKTSDVGTYSIEISGGSADNYQFAYTSGVLTINKAEQTIEWEQELDDLKAGDNVLLTANASSGLPITYTIDNSTIAEIYSIGDKTYLDCISGGKLNIVAVQLGNNNYYSTPRARKIVVIQDGGYVDVVKGDVNNDGKADISDVVAVINTMAGDTTFKSTSDVNNDGKTDISDVVAIINIMAGV
jgi:hypothetical protein